MAQKILILFPPTPIDKAFILDCVLAFKHLGHTCRAVEISAGDAKVVEDELLLIEEFKPDLIFALNSIGLVPRYYHALGGIPYVSWFYDDPISYHKMNKFEMINSPFYFAFSWDKSYIEEMRSHGYRNVSYLPLCTNPQNFQPQALSSEDQDKYGADISFVGSPFDPHMKKFRTVEPRLYYRQEMVAELGKHFKVKVYGDTGWENVENDNVTYMGFADNRLEIPKIYSASKIILNLTATQIRTAFPSRIYDALACKAFVLSDFRKSAFEQFEVGKHLELFSSTEELISKAKHFLAHEDLRQNIAQAGHEHVLKHHHFVERLQSMLQTIEEMQDHEAQRAYKKAYMQNPQNRQDFLDLAHLFAAYKLENRATYFQSRASKLT